MNQVVSHSYYTERGYLLPLTTLSLRLPHRYRTAIAKDIEQRFSSRHQRRPGVNVPGRDAHDETLAQALSRYRRRVSSRLLNAAMMDFLRDCGFCPHDYEIKDFTEELNNIPGQDFPFDARAKHIVFNESAIYKESRSGRAIALAPTQAYDTLCTRLRIDGLEKFEWVCFA